MILPTRLLLILAIISAFSFSVLSATKTWTGNGSDNKFSNPANWAENLAAAYGDDLIFPAVSAQYSPQCDILMSPGNSSFQYFNSVVFQGGNYTIASFISITGGLIINGGNQTFNTPPGGNVVRPSIFIAEGATLTDTISTKYSSFSINGLGSSAIIAGGCCGNEVTKNDSGTADFRWTDGNQIQQINVNGGKFIARGGLTQALSIFNVTNGTVEGYTGYVNTKISFSGTNSVYKQSGYTSSSMVEFLNGAQYSPTTCIQSQISTFNLNLTGAIFSPLYTSCSSNIITLFLITSSNLVTGSFSNYAEGSTVSIGGVNYRMTYKGGDGNDVQLIKVPRIMDFDGDNKTDIGIFRPSNGQWWINRSSNGQTNALQFGASTDKTVPADFSGDGKTDLAIFRPSTNEWFILRSEDNSFYSFPFGAAGDVPLVGDFDGDGKSDPTIFRPSTREWFVSKSSGGTLIVTFGLSGDQPVLADYDGDGKTDFAIYRPNVGQWWISRSSNGSVYAFQFGTSTDKPVQGDYTGDGKADTAIFRPSTGEWFILRSEDNSFYSVPFGIPTDLPTPGDYDGDGKFDTAVFRPSENTWYVQRSTAGILFAQFGINGDKPLPNVFVP